MTQQPETAADDPLGDLRKWSDAAARLLGRDTAKWEGYAFSGEPGKGMFVTGRAKRERSASVFVPLSEVNQ